MSFKVIADDISQIFYFSEKIRHDISYEWSYHSHEILSLMFSGKKYQALLSLKKKKKKQNTRMPSVAVVTDTLRLVSLSANN